ncbi:MAG: 30S ribosome-binding factor RbfA [Flavobacteriales bacterium]|jgi:ribosome-binding factor A|nr:30S ribosome-binding factor RbfA [Flavobacteriales bacterium]MDG1440982.1 30S ribosome-binding factor RbfA [Flavobacteriales bacterium]|tara:strand:+ start:315 stop:647 length:333 start_codon:yes stop_codon:yes gene_type:complete
MSVRQEKIASVIKKELGKYLQQNAVVVAKGAMVTVTVVRMSPDLSIAKVYISIFGGKNNNESFDNIVNQSKLIRHEISKIVRNQLRKMPELHFYRDDSFDYAQEIDKLLQ